MIYFKFEIELQEVSNLTYQLPEELILFIKVDPTSDWYYGIIRDDYYDELLKNLSRESINSLEIVSRAEVSQFIPGRDKGAHQRQFYGNMDLLV